MTFSIIIPIYNVEKYLRQCIDSVLAENFLDCEIILVNDGSPDGCGEICDEYANKFSHIKVIHKHNGGLSDARNAGIKEAKGDYLIFLDSDDYWININKNQKNYIGGGGGILSDLQLLTNDKIDLILHPSSDNIRRIPKEISFTNNDFINNFEALVKSNYYVSNAWTKIVRREIIIKNNLFFPKGYIHEDLPYSLALARFVKTFAIYNNPFYQYRVLDDSISHNIKYKNFNDILVHLNKGIDFLIKNGDSPVHDGLKTLLFHNIHYIKTILERLHLSKNIIIIFYKYFSFRNKCRKIFGPKEINTMFMGKKEFIIKLPILYPIKALYYKYFSK